ncbi:MAG: hypothetical protein HQL46_01805 [Gammaproteobacteria bacterium]|nr:hypothetical protein [Gammaproteobacteria bacterium]
MTTNKSNEELIQEIEHLKVLNNHLQTQMHSQKLFIRALISTLDNSEEIESTYQQLIDEYEQESNKILPNLLVSC